MDNETFDKTDFLPGLQAAIDHLLSDKERPRVLDAGCGSTCHLKLDLDTRLVGIDISKEKLAKNYSLDEKILGDVQTYNFGGKRFDAVIFWDVLEHLDDPKKALDNLLAVIRPGGLLVIKSHHVYSLAGMLTKLTSPKTFQLSPLSLNKWAERKNLTLEFFQAGEGAQRLEGKSRPVRSFYKTIFPIVQVFGLNGLSEQGFAAVFSRPETDSDRNSR